MKSLHRIQLDAVLEPALSVLPPFKKTLDIGGGQNNPYRAFFQTKEYVLFDSNLGGKEGVEGDAHALPFPDKSFDFVLITETLEHCHSPQRVMDEIRRVLKPKGHCVGSVPFLYPYHASGGMKDYYRYTRDGLLHLFRAFSSVDVTGFGSLFTFEWTRLGGRVKYVKALNPLLKRIHSARNPAGFVFVLRK